MHRLQELVRLHRSGTKAREVARLLRMGRNTERRYRSAISKAGLLRGELAELPSQEELKAAVLEHAPPKLPPQQESSVERWRPVVEQLQDRGCGPTAIYDRLRIEEPEFAGSLAAVKRLVATLKRERGPVAEDVVIPVETEPGDVAQVDFGYAGYRIDPATQKLRKSWVFVMVLGYSRHQFSKVVFDQRTSTWLSARNAASLRGPTAARCRVVRSVRRATLRRLGIHRGRSTRFGLASANRGHRGE
ncbi:MAG: hypothetical protein R3B13_18860 [Polyangiaceae bacterium]